MNRIDTFTKGVTTFLDGYRACAIRSDCLGLTKSICPQCQRPACDDCSDENGMCIPCTPMDVILEGVNGRD